MKQNNKDSKKSKKISLEFDVVELEKKLAPNESGTYQGPEDYQNPFPTGEGAEC